MCWLDGVDGRCTLRDTTRRGSDKRQCSRTELESRTIEGERPVGEDMVSSWYMFPSNTDHVKVGVNPGRPLPQAKYTPATDSEQYREEKVKRTPARGVK